MSEVLVEQVVRSAVGNGVAPGVAFGVVVGGEQHTWYAGTHDPAGAGRTVDASSRFDLASLTKPFSTTLWALRLLEAGRLGLDAPIQRYLPDASAALGLVPIWRLMNHTAGLAAHREYFRGLGPAILRGAGHESAVRAIRRMVLGAALAYAPGAREVYSDLGYLVLQWVCEAAAEAPLSAVWPTLPGHGRDRLHFRPLTAAGGDDDLYVPTEDCPWRGRRLRGEVHDDNCWTLGGVAGHAGLFGTLEDTLSLARDLLGLARGTPSVSGVTPALFQSTLVSRWMHPRGTRVLGWDTPTPGASTSGRHFNRSAFGHLGFTGTSVWIDAEADVAMVLLTNRVCPTRDNPRIRAFRPAVHNAAWASFVAERST